MSMFKHSLWCGALAGALLVVGGCGDDDTGSGGAGTTSGNGSTTTSGDTTSSTTSGGTGGGGGDATTASGAGGGGGDGGAGGGGGGAVDLTDDEVAHVVQTANAGEILQAETAMPKLEVPDVVTYAEMMITEHGGANTELQQLAAAEGLTPEPNPVSADLQAESEAIVASLDAAAAPVDPLYVDSQVLAHAQVLELIETVLLPSAENEALVAFLETMRGAVEMHLMEAEQLQEELGEEQP